MTVGMVDVPRAPVGEAIDSAFEWLTDNLGSFFDLVSSGISFAVEGLFELLVAPPALILALVFALLGMLVRSWQFAVGAFLSFVLVISMEQLDTAMETLALVVLAAAIALLIGIPVGVLAARSDRVSAVTKPILDLMQTMPAFVWLVPVVTLFGIGLVPGVVATIIFALPPGVRLTELGIRQVDAEIVEAGHAFGSSPGQILRGIQIPLATPTIMAGVNQVIMLSLSMAVIAGLVGGGGLGGQVVTAISRLNIGLGFEAGIAVVILAIYLDRVTAAVGQRGPGGGGSLRRLRSVRRTRQTRSEPTAEPAGAEVTQS
jgi:glycine betaine/proline transport system permease protein